MSLARLFATKSTLPVSFLLKATAARNFSTAPKLNELVEKNVLDEALAYRPNPEFHMFSTRYTSCNREYLKLLEQYWGKQERRQPKGISDKLASGSVNSLFWLANLYFRNNYIDRAIMLETVASLPGLVCCNLHHLRSLRRLRHDEWVKPLIDEAENERMHLLSFMNLEPLRWDKKVMIKIVQFGFIFLYVPLYVFAPRTCHRFVGFLEEHAVHTYDTMIEAIDQGKLKNYPACKISKEYWGLPEDATLRDNILVIRGDEADHRMVNHGLADEFDNKLQIPGKKWYAGIKFNIDLHSRFGPYMKFDSENPKNETA
ncbi:hypothetical protein WA158_007981 [Blastocystis sp. Blastoise]